jgi:DNA polymerase I
VTPHELPFAEIWLVDFEFVSNPGEHPDVVCLVAHELRTERTISLWRDQLGHQPPYRTDAEALFVCYVANAECACHLALGWPLPERILDLSPEFRNATNGLRIPGDVGVKKNKKAKKGLLNALRYYGLDTIPAVRNNAMQQRAMRGWPFAVDERREILDYCAEDVDALARLLPKMLPDINLPIALYRGEFVAVSARMEHAGVPLDAEVCTRLQDQRTWASVRDAMVPAVDARYGLYVRGKDGEWHFNHNLFESYTEREKIPWPRTERGKLDLRDKTFEEMSKARTQLQALRQLRHVRNKMRKIKLAVGRDGRNRTVLWAFASKTSRSQPDASKWIFSPAVWLRSLIKPEPGQAVAYVDYSAMEFLIAAALSDRHCGPTNPMLDMYLSGDPYSTYAKQIGAMPPDAGKDFQDNRGIVRDRYKVFLLATLYGMAAQTLSERLGVPDFEAHGMLDQHLALFAQYWQWSDDWVAHALRTGVMRTAFDWTCRTGITELNERSIRNWPIQATGAEILRIACIIATRHGLRLLAPVHDAILIEAPLNQIDGDVALLREIMRRASRVVLSPSDGRTFELRSDAKIVRYPDRYIDNRGFELWNQVLEQLATCEQAEGAVRAAR